MTETAAAVTISLPTCPNLGHVGPPVASSELRLRSVPEMNYNVRHYHVIVRLIMATLTNSRSLMNIRGERSRCVAATYSKVSFQR